jgi:hypothetical protein
MKSYEFTVTKGVIGDFVAEWMTEKDWENHAIYVNELKEKGEYLKEEKCTLSLIHNPLFDDQTISTPVIESMRIEFLDLTKK